MTLDKEQTIVEHSNPVTSATNLSHFQKYLTNLTQSVEDFLAARARKQSDDDDNDDEENDDDDDNNETSGRHSREQ